ncbi:MAG TPA: rhodanese-like domain-containing protein [Ignavibacteria bacterium]|nr:rhodanese-like domain-containing protein [Ignavibacteria bacterium]
MKNKIIIISIAAIAAVFFVYNFFLAGTSEFSVDSLRFEELANEQNVVILDVRSKFEYGGDKIAGAQNISYSAADFNSRIEQLDRNKTYLLYCASGSRSAGACRIMKDKGFKKIYNLAGGIDHWKSEGKPVIR